jgi:hypothetical protein
MHSSGKFLISAIVGLIITAIFITLTIFYANQLKYTSATAFACLSVISGIFTFALFAYAGWSWWEGKSSTSQKNE